MNEAGIYTDVFVVKDWQDLIPQDELDLFNKLDDLMKSLFEKAKKDVLNDERLNVYADTITKAKNEQKRIIYKYDFQKFVDEMFGTQYGEEEETVLQDKVETPWFHIQMYNAFQQSKRVCVVCPRGHGKSSASRLYILHQILNKEIRYCVIVGSSESMAGQNMRWIRDQLTDNQRLKEIYGDISSKKKWAETEFVTSTKIKVVAKGAGQSLRGENETGRPDLIYIDDIENDEAVRNKENRMILAKWFKEAILPMKSQNGRFIMTGTILDVDSLLKNVALNVVRDHIKWKVLWYQALNVDDKGKEYALWEQMKPLSELKALKEIDPQTFAQEYQNNPTSGQQAVFQINWFEWFSREHIKRLDNGKITIFDRPVNLMLHTDLAISEREGSDFTVIGISAMDDKGNLFWPEIIRFRSSDIYDIIQEIFRMVKDWMIDFVTMETIAFQKAIKRQIEREMEINKTFFHIEEMSRSNTTKMARFKSLQSPIKAGKMFFLQDQRPLIEMEFLKLTATKLPPHDDVLDVVSDGWEKQDEYRISAVKQNYEINTIEWAEKQGFLPKTTFVEQKKRRGVR